MRVPSTRPGGKTVLRSKRHGGKRRAALHALCARPGRHAGGWSIRSLERAGGSGRGAQGAADTPVNGKRKKDRTGALAAPVAWLQRVPGLAGRGFSRAARPQGRARVPAAAPAARRSLAAVRRAGCGGRWDATGRGCSRRLGCVGRWGEGGLYKGREKCSAGEPSCARLSFLQGEIGSGALGASQHR
jgi:hypothetical protein